MSVKDYDKVIQFEDSTIGNVLYTFPYADFGYETINYFVNDLFWKIVMKDEHSFTIKLGYKSH